MAALSSKARALIEEAHEDVRAPAGERERLEALLDAQLGATVPSVIEPALPAVRAGGWRLVTSLAVGAAVVGGAALWILQPGPPQNPVSPLAIASSAAKPPEAAVASAEPTVEAPALLAPEQTPPAKPPVEAQAPAQRSQDRLAQEVALLSRATSELRAGRSGAALKLLDEHQRTFPNGVLAVERRAVRAQTLCTLKRVSEGRAELSHLAPQSPAAGRAKQLCDAAEASSKR